MKNNPSPFLKRFACLFILFMMPGCSSMQDITQTIQSTQTNTAMAASPIPPTATRTVRPTVDIQPTPTITEFLLMTDEIITSIDGSFSIQAPSSFNVQETDNFISFHDSSLYVSASILSNPEGIEILYSAPEDELCLFSLSALGTGGGGGFSMSDPYPVIIDDVEGVGFDFSGSRFDTPIQGEVIIVKRNHTEILIITGLSLLDENDQQWSEYDQPFFEEILESFRFNRRSPCFISSNPDYGYIENLPIGLGGGEFAGEALVEVYLSSLAGPDGQALTYENIGSMPYDNTTLLRYRVSYPGISAPVELFFDINNFTNPMAPAGFSCQNDFEFGLP